MTSFHAVNCCHLVSEQEASGQRQFVIRINTSTFVSVFFLYERTVTFHPQDDSLELTETEKFRARIDQKQKKRKTAKKENPTSRKLKKSISSCALLIIMTKILVEASRAETILRKVSGEYRLGDVKKRPQRRTGYIIAECYSVNVVTQYPHRQLLITALLLRLA